MKLELEATRQNSLDYNQFSEEGSSEDTAECLRAAVEAAQTGDRAEARELLLFVTESEPRNETAWLWLASISEYPEELLVFLQKVLSINPANKRALEWAAATESLLAKTFLARGASAVRENKSEFARQCFSQAIAHEPQNAAAWLELASVADAPEEKIGYLEKALSIEPDNKNALIALEITHEKARQALLKKANFAAISGERENAEQMLEELFGDAPELEEAWILKAYLAEESAEKIACYEKVLQMNPESAAAQAGMASLEAMRQKSVEQKNFAAALQKAFAENESLKRQNLAEEFSESSVSASSDEQSVEGSTPAEFAPSENAPLPDFPGGPDIELPAAENFPEESSIVPAQKSVSDSEIIETANQSDDFHGEDIADDSVYDLSNISENEIINFSLEDEFGQTDSAKVFETNKDSGDGGNFSEPDSPQTETPGKEKLFDEPDFFIHEAEAIGFQENLLDSETENNSSEDATENQAPEILARDSAFDSNDDAESAIHKIFTQAEPSACPFCAVVNEGQAVACRACRTMLSLSDLEAMLAYRDADAEVLQAAINAFEIEKSRRALTVEELSLLAIAHFNIKNSRAGFNCLQEALRLNPNNILLSSRVNFLAIRLAEIEEKQPRSAPDAAQKCCTIMIVDDNPTVRRLVAGKLEKCGHAVIAAESGTDALSKIGEVTPDLILLDIAMPQMDGYEICKFIRGNAATKDVPVLLISGKDGLFDAARGQAAGSTGFIAKPFGPEALMRAVETYLT